MYKLYKAMRKVALGCLCLVLVGCLSYAPTHKLFNGAFHSQV